MRGRCPVGPASRGGNPVHQIVFPLRIGFDPVSDDAGVLVARVQDDKTHVGAVGSGGGGKFLRRASLLYRHGDVASQTAKNRAPPWRNGGSVRKFTG